MVFARGLADTWLTLFVVNDIEVKACGPVLKARGYPGCNYIMFLSLSIGNG